MKGTHAKRQRGCRSGRAAVVRIGSAMAIIGLAIAAFVVLDFFFHITCGLGLTRWGASSRAFHALQAGDLEKALYWANRTIRIDPTFSDAYVVRGQVHEARGDLQLAVKDFTQALECETPERSARIFRARVYEKLGSVDLAIADYRGAILPILRSSYRPRDVARQRAGRGGDPRASLDELIKLFDDGIQRNPDDKELQTCRSWLLSSKEDQNTLHAEKTAGH